MPIAYYVPRGRRHVDLACESWCFPLLIQVSGELYETWMNYHAEVCLPALACLALQEEISLHFFDDRSARAKVIAVPNQLRTFWRDTMRRLAKSPPWSLAAFDVARDRVLAMCPTVSDLWRSLGRNTGVP